MSPRGCGCSRMHGSGVGRMMPERLESSFSAALFGRFPALLKGFPDVEWKHAGTSYKAERRSDELLERVLHRQLHLTRRRSFSQDAEVGGSELVHSRLPLQDEVGVVGGVEDFEPELQLLALAHLEATA